MKIFICWSRGRSETLAHVLSAWLPRVVDGVEPFLSSEIEKGRRWFDEVSSALSEAQTGLVCLTPECVRAPWLHFEAGALASAVDGRLYTYLHGVKPEQLSGPLSAFQSTVANEDDTRRLVAALAQESAPDGAIDEAGLRLRFERAWPELATTLRHLDEVIVETAVPGFAELFNTKTFTEPMRECPDLGWIARHERLARVDAVLTDRRDEVVALGLPHLARLYDDLRHQIDLYLMNVRSKLLTARPFAPAADGLLDIPKDVLDGCETPRLRVHALVQRLLDPLGAPVMDDALRFEGLDADQKKVLIQALERRVAAGQPVVPSDLRARALDSRWDLDRIASYLSIELEGAPERQLGAIVEQVRRELELVEARKLRSSLMGLYYSIRALDIALQRTGPDSAIRQSAADAIADVERYINADPARDERRKFAGRIARIQERLAAGPAPT